MISLFAFLAACALFVTPDAWFKGDSAFERRITRMAVVLLALVLAIYLKL